MTPEEIKAEAFDKIKVAHKEMHELDASDEIHNIIKQADHDVDEFWKRMKKFDDDIMSGKNRAFSMDREWVNYPSGERRFERWNPDTQKWEALSKS